MVRSTALSPLVNLIICSLGRLNMDGDEIGLMSRSQEEELRREIEEMDRHFDDALRARGELDLLSPSARLEAENARDGSSGANALPQGLREQLADGTPYSLNPLPQPLNQGRNSTTGGRRIAVPASNFSDFAAR